MKALAVVLTMAVVCLATSSGFAQDPNNVAAAGGIGVGARAIGMGGAFTAVADGPTAIYWNPAGLAMSDGFRSDFSVTGQVDNLDVFEDAQDVLDALRSDVITQQEFLDLFDAAGRLSGRPVTMEASTDIVFSYDGLAVGAWGQAGGQATLVRTPATGAFDPAADASVSVTGNALAYWAAGAGYGRMVSKNVAVGLTLKQLNVRRAVADYAASYSAATTTFTDVDNNQTSDEDSAVTADLGLMYWPQPEKYEGRVRLGAMVRNLTSPSFDVALPGVDGITTLDFDASFDVGLAVQSTNCRTLFALDLHNLFGANDASTILCLGVEHQFSKWLALRAGLYDGELTKGLTARLGAFSVSAAIGSSWDDLASFSVSWDF